MKVFEGNILFVEDGLEELLHLLGLVEEHLLFKALDEGVDIGWLGGVNLEEVEDSVFEVLYPEFGGLGVLGGWDRV